jgi:[pyruvate, water dikinase]-phosphate phosphotransferase / [pyruvate, water dikinase] kinase
VVLVGVSRTSKTPTSIYLANRGVKVANVPVVPDCPLPPELERLRGPLVVGLTISPEPLVQIRMNRLRQLHLENERRISAAFEGD